MPARKNTKHSPETIAKIEAARAKQTITPAMRRGLLIGRGKTWTPEMRARLSKIAKERKLGHGKGKDSAAWRGGRTPLVRAYRVSPRYKIWRRSVLARDKFTCLKCGAIEQLEVNHIVTVKNIFIEKKFTNMQQIHDCDILWDINNGETLCRSCHRLVPDTTS